MSTSEISKSTFQSLKAFFDRDVCQRATKPLRDGTQIAVYLDGAGPTTLGKHGGRIGLFESPPVSPDMTFWVTTAGVEALSELKTEDIGEVGVAIAKLMIHNDPKQRLRAKVHIGSFSLLRNGYLGVLPLGGATVMKFLASKGLTSIGKIKDAIASFKG